MVAGTEVCANTILPCPDTCTVPPLNVAWLPLLFGLGITTIVIVAVEPDCKDGMLQLTVLAVDTPPQVPEVVAADWKVSGTPVTVELRLSVTVILLARSGPLFVMV